MKVHFSSNGYSEYKGFLLSYTIRKKFTELDIHVHFDILLFFVL